MSCEVPSPPSFLGKVFGELRPLGEFLFFLSDHSLGKILTGDNLIGVTCVRGVGSWWMIFCFIAMDSIAFELWSLEFCLFGLHWVMPHKVIELFESWQGKFRRHRNIDFWRLVPHCLMWCIWSKRNARCFGGCERSLLEIKSFFLLTILIWSVALSHSSCFSLPILLDHCSFVS